MDTKYTLRERVAGQFSAPVDYYLVSRQRHVGLLRKLRLIPVDLRPSIFVCTALNIDHIFLIYK